MMKLHCLTLGDYMTNCYILHQDGSDRCIVVDPGYEAERIAHYLDGLHLTVDAILLTHGHFDHVGAVAAIAAETDCEVYISAEELSMPPMMTGGKLYYTRTYDASGAVQAAGMTLRVIPTPGHTPGSVCLVAEDILISGDTLFAGSCGRTDLPGGNWAQISRSLKTLAALPGDYQVLPGHGGATTLAQERKYNPYM